VRLKRRSLKQENPAPRPPDSDSVGRPPAACAVRRAIGWGCKDEVKSSAFEMERGSRAGRVALCREKGKKGQWQRGGDAYETPAVHNLRAIESHSQRRIRLPLPRHRRSAKIIEIGKNER
jgi:hypothetical protein